FVLPRDIAGAKPAVAKRGSRLLRIVEISQHHDRCLDGDFAVLAARDFAPLLVDHLHLYERTAEARMARWLADAADPALAVERVVARTGDLGHAVALDQMRNGELVLEHIAHLGTDRAAVDFRDPVRRVEFAARALGEDVADRSDRVEDRGTAFRRQVPQSR